MATATDVAWLREGNAALEALALRSLRDFWASLDLSRPEAARNALVEVLPLITEQYGEAAAVLAADWYDELRAAEGVPGSFRAVLASPVPAVAPIEQVRFGAKHLFTDDPGQLLSFLEGQTSKYVLQPGRDTIQRSTVADPAARGWHREVRPGACKFCLLLHGRGGVYTEQSVRFAAHHHCHCVGVPSWDADAPEVPASAYVASKRTSRMSPQQRAEHNRALREYMAQMGD